MRPLFLAALLCSVVFFHNASRAETGDADALKHALLSFHWQWDENGKPGQRPADFEPDGRLRNPKGGGVTHYRWEVTGPHTFTLTSGKGVSYFTINEALTQFAGEHAGTNAHITGIRGEPVTDSPPSGNNSPPMPTPQPKPDSAVPTSTPSATPVSGAANLPPTPRTKIDELREHVTTLKESILAPLDQPDAPGLRDYIGDLKEDLLDESARQPATSAAAYSLALQLCNTLLAVESEREVTVARLNNNLPTNATAGAFTRKVHPTWVDLELAIHQAAAATRNNKTETTFHRQIRVQWGLRTVELRNTIELKVSLFREAVRQNLSQN